MGSKAQLGLASNCNVDEGEASTGVTAGSGVEAVDSALRHEESVGNGGIGREIGSLTDTVATF